MNKDNNHICPELWSLSDEIQVSGLGLHETTKLGQFELFQHQVLPNNNGVLAFIGGPVTAIDWNPVFTGICVVGAHRTDTLTHEVLTCYQGEAHIQLWSIAAERTACIGVIKHDGNCTWDIKWRPNHTGNSFVAALGDGSAIVCEVSVDNLQPASDDSAQIGLLYPSVLKLGLSPQNSRRSPIRAVDWSEDGKRVALGCANGSIMIYEASTVDNVWPYWSFPAQESVIVDVRWISNSHICSLGMSCMLRMRDIRDPSTILDQSSEGLSGSQAMDVLEPHVAVVGADGGALRISRLTGIDGVQVKHSLKRVRLQASAFRDIKSIPINPRGSDFRDTLLYAAGAEGRVHECIFPRPIWISPGNCRMGFSRVQQKLHWVMVTEGEANRIVPRKTFDEEENEDAILPQNLKDTSFSCLRLHLGPGEAKTDAEPNHARSSAVTEQADGISKQVEVASKSKPNKSSIKKSRAVKADGIADEYSFFGTAYNQKVVVSRIAISKQGMLAVGIDGGFLTCVPFAHNHRSQEEGSKVTSDLCSALTNRKPRAPRKVKIKVPGRKRGRPRKHPLPGPAAETPNSQSTTAVEKTAQNDNRVLSQSDIGPPNALSDQMTTAP